MYHHAHPFIRRPDSLTPSGIERFQIVHLEIRLSKPRLVQQLDRCKAKIRQIIISYQVCFPSNTHTRNITTAIRDSQVTTPPYSARENSSVKFLKTFNVRSVFVVFAGKRIGPIRPLLSCPF
jgi:hypothetical protein